MKEATKHALGDQPGPSSPPNDASGQAFPCDQPVVRSPPEGGAVARNGGLQFFANRQIAGSKHEVGNRTLSFLRRERLVYVSDLSAVTGRERGRILGMIDCLDRAIAEIERLISLKAKTGAVARSARSTPKSKPQETP